MVSVEHLILYHLPQLLQEKENILVRILSKNVWLAFRKEFTTIDSYPKICVRAMVWRPHHLCVQNVQMNLIIAVKV